MLKKINKYFTLYEKTWFISILIISLIMAFIFPESDVNSVNGIIITNLYLLDIILNISCELLISKQNKYNFIISLFVEIIEIITLIILSSRFATMAVTIFFWIPIDIISFISWNKNTDKKDEIITKVRKLSTKKSILVTILIIIWTIIVGYLMAKYMPDTDFYDSDKILKIVCYLDACASAVGITNGIFILLRYREQWISWYIVTILESVINIISGQYILLILKIGFLTNTTYGYIKWTKYIKNNMSIDTFS